MLEDKHLKYRQLRRLLSRHNVDEILMESELEEWHKLHKFYMGDYQTKDLAIYLGISPRTIQRWIKEQTKPNSGQLAQIKKYLESKQS